MKSRDTHDMIMLQRHLYGFMEIDRAWSCWVSLLSEG
jgi:hypothetical protein